MRKYLLLALLIASTFIRLQARLYPVATIHVLRPNGLKVVNKLTGKITVCDMSTGYFEDQWRIKDMTRPNAWVGLNALAIRPDTIWVGSNDGVLTSITDGRTDTTVHYVNHDENKVNDLSYLLTIL